ncbi:GMP synthase [glutamine-hydrolyzing] [Gossypium arboreum]|uniref:GMP synthase [glutamine-hydrolyzing] n=1 Tax=Gossypium arboreum TaxID=29729 RepID=A0A0B0NDM2_GOSAR|nr:GMP synthase [glutamine-hydrolyzing] [Gossypium arboreum]
MSGTWHRPPYESQSSYSKLMRNESSCVTSMFHQVSIRNQGTSEASITLSPEAFGIAS